MLRILGHCTTRWGSLAIKDLTLWHDCSFVIICTDGSSLYLSFPLCVLSKWLELKESQIKMAFYSLIFKHKHTYRQWFLPLLSCFLRCGHFFMLKAIFPIICSKWPHHRIKQNSPQRIARKISVALIYGHLGLGQHGGSICGGAALQLVWWMVLLVLVLGGYQLICCKLYQKGSSCVGQLDKCSQTHFPLFHFPPGGFCGLIHTV